LILALLVLFQQPSGHGPEPGPRQVLAGTTGFQTVSRIDFGDHQNRLTAAYVFPDRVRWHFENYSAVHSEHQYFYRQGESVWTLEHGTTHSVSGPDRSALLLQMELRRAALFWPDGFDWKASAEGVHSAAVFEDSCCREGALGSLVATVKDGLAERIVARDGQERTIETIEIRTWQERNARKWPLTLELKSDHGSFVETIEEVDTRIHFLELSFLPPDKRPIVASSTGPTVQSREIVAMTYSSRALPAGTSWDDAKARAKEWLTRAAEDLKPLGLLVDPVPTFELSSEGLPARCLLRLSAPVAPAPEGYETQPERVGVFVTLGDLKSIDAKLLERLKLSGPEDSHPGIPYVRIRTTDPPIEVVLPLGSDR
jgi:hypothetical protein